MLVLTRRTKEIILINYNIEIHILDIENNQVKIGVKAPTQFKVYRKEVFDRIKEENQAAVLATNKDSAKILADKIKSSQK